MLAKICKFGLQYCDLPTMLDNVAVLLRVLTLNIDRKHTKRASVLLFVINIIGAGCYFYVYLWSMLWSVFWRCRENNDVISAMIVFSLGLSSEIGMSKLLFVHLYKMFANLRKFGLQHCELPTMLDNVAVLLRVLALNIDSKRTERAPLLLVAANIIGAGCYFYIYLWSMIWFVFWRCRETGDVITAMIVFSLGVASEIGMSKLFFMFLYKNKVKKIVDGYLACDAVVEPGSRFSRNLMNYLRIVKRRALIFWLVINGNGIVYIMKAVITPGRHLMEDAFIIYGLEPLFASPNFEIAFICNIAGVFFTCYPAAIVTAFLIVTTGYTEAQMLALSKEMLFLWDDANDHYRAITNNTEMSISYGMETEKGKILNDFIKNKLESIIRSHVKNLTLVHQIESVFRVAIAVEFFLLVVGLIAELLGGLENTYLEIPYALMQVAMDCLTGQRLMDASIEFQNAVYDCRWENFDRSNMKTVLLMLQISQRKITISAGGITTLSFQSLMSVIRSIYSAYTTLRTTMS